MKDGIVLANRYNDLVAVDIRDVNNVRELQRTTDVFPDEAQVTPEGVISHYNKTADRERRTCEDPFFGNMWVTDGNGVFVGSMFSRQM